MCRTAAMLCLCPETLRKSCLCSVRVPINRKLSAPGVYRPVSVWAGAVSAGRLPILLAGPSGMASDLSNSGAAVWRD